MSESVTCTICRNVLYRICLRHTVGMAANRVTLPARYSPTIATPLSSRFILRSRQRCKGLPSTSPYAARESETSRLPPSRRLRTGHVPTDTSSTHNFCFQRRAPASRAAPNDTHRAMASLHGKTFCFGGPALRFEECFSSEALCEPYLWRSVTSGSKLHLARCAPNLRSRPLLPANP